MTKKYHKYTKDEIVSVLDTVLNQYAELAEMVGNNEVIDTREEGEDNITQAIDTAYNIISERNIQRYFIDGADPEAMERVRHAYDEWMWSRSTCLSDDAPLSEDKYFLAKVVRILEKSKCEMWEALDEAYNQYHA